MAASQVSAEDVQKLLNYHRNNTSVMAKIPNPTGAPDSTIRGIEVPGDHYQLMTEIVRAINGDRPSAWSSSITNAPSLGTMIIDTTRHANRPESEQARQIAEQFDKAFQNASAEDVAKRINLNREMDGMSVDRGTHGLGGRGLESRNNTQGVKL